MIVLWLHKFNQTVILIRLLLTFKIINIIKLRQLIICCWRRNREKLEETISLSKLCVIKSVTYTVPVISTTLRWIRFRRFRHQARSWCIPRWAVVSKWTTCQNQRVDQCKHKKDLEPNWIQRPKSILNRWTRSKRREQNPLLKLD